MADALARGGQRRRREGTYDGCWLGRLDGQSVRLDCDSRAGGLGLLVVALDLESLLVFCCARLQFSPSRLCPALLCADRATRLNLLWLSWR